jgi:hypothetical protein
MNATDRAAVTAAANALDVRLANDPFADSESRDDPTRVMLVAPLGIFYDVDDAVRLVTVWSVWRFV